MTIYTGEWRITIEAGGTTGEDLPFSLYRMLYSHSGPNWKEPWWCMSAHTKEELEAICSAMGREAFPHNEDIADIGQYVIVPMDDDDAWLANFEEG